MHQPMTMPWDTNQTQPGATWHTANSRFLKMLNATILWWILQQLFIILLRKLQSAWRENVKWAARWGREHDGTANTGTDTLKGLFITRAEDGKSEKM